MQTPLIIAHRGASELAPENTLAAFQRAIDDGADGIEFDVRLSKGNIPVVFHDGTLRRLSGKTGLVSHLTAAELVRIDVGSWFNRRFPDKKDEKFALQTIPTLAQTLIFLENFTGLIYIELKCRETEIEVLSQAVCRIIENSPLLPQIIIKSFQLEAIPTVRKLCPNVKTAALFALKIMTILRKEKRIVSIAHELGAQMISVQYQLATKKLMSNAAKRNLPVTIWTANNPNWAKRAADLEIYAVITNNPARLLAGRDKK